MRTITEWKDIVILGYGKNMIVYDCDSHGRPTFELIRLMKTTHHRQYSPPSGLTHIYIGNYGFKQLMNSLNKRTYHIGEKREFINSERVTILGIEICTLSHLGINSILNNYFVNELQGNLPEFDEEILIGINENGTIADRNILLGSY